jgi:hypothetical protein
LCNFDNEIFILDLENYLTRLSWSNGLFCDFNLIVNVYNLWVFDRERRKSKKEEKLWAERSNLNLKSLYQLEALKEKIEKTLNNYGISIENEIERNSKRDIATEQDLVDENFVLKFMVAGA